MAICSPILIFIMLHYTDCKATAELEEKSNGLYLENSALADYSCIFLFALYFSQTCPLQREPALCTWRCYFSPCFIFQCAHPVVLEQPSLSILEKSLRREPQPWVLVPCQDLQLWTNVGHSSVLDRENMWQLPFTWVMFSASYHLNNQSAPHL